MEQFVEGIMKEFAEEQYADTRAQLELCCALYGLWCLERGMAFYLCQEYISPIKARAIKYQVDKLCEEITPNVLALLEGFGVPETTPDNQNLPPIAKNFMEHYKYSNWERMNKKKEAKL